ncbi:MAG: hypothetical protein WBG90_01285 [Saonia sp.]
MNRKIKLIWDFRGPDAHKIAEHHEKHLKEYAMTEELGFHITGHKEMSETHSIAYMVVEESIMIQVRDALIPHRGEIYEHP